MVMVINGELVPDDDPRAIQFRQRAAAGTAGGAGAARGGVNNVRRINSQDNGGRPEQAGRGADGAQGQGRRDLFAKYVPPGSGPAQFNEQLSRTVPPITLGGVVFQPALLLALAVIAFAFGLRAAIGAALVAFLLA
jgi:hypothetical protein